MVIIALAGLMKGRSDGKKHRRGDGQEGRIVASVPESRSQPEHLCYH